MTDMRTSFVATATRLLDEDPRTAVVLADISSDQFEGAAHRHPDRVLNVGIREPLMVSVAGGLALAGMRPIAHSYAPFLIERSFEQVKLDLSHQGTSAVLVSVGASYDSSGSGRTHHSPGDVALIDTLPGWAIHVPGHPDEAAALVSRAVEADRPAYIRLSSSSNADAHYPTTPGALTVLHTGRRAVVLAVGPMLDSVLQATTGLDVTVAYASTVRPLDVAGLRAAAAAAAGPHDPASVIVVEPYLAGTSARLVADAFVDRAYRLLSLGVDRIEARRYGSPADHEALYGLDPAGLRGSVTAFLTARS